MKGPNPQERFTKYSKLRQILLVFCSYPISSSPLLRILNKPKKEIYVSKGWVLQRTREPF